MKRYLYDSHVSGALVSSQHKKPILAFVVLAVIAAAVIGNQFRASAENSRFIAAGPISAHTSVTRGAVPVPAEELPADASSDAGASVESSPDQPKHLPMATAFYDNATLASEPVTAAPGESHHTGTLATRQKASKPARSHGKPVADPAKKPGSQPVRTEIWKVVRKPVGSTARALTDTLAGVVERPAHRGGRHAATKDGRSSWAPGQPKKLLDGRRGRAGHGLGLIRR